MSTTLKLVVSMVLRMTVSVTFLFVVSSCTSPLFTFTVASATPFTAVSLFWSLRPQPVHSQPLIRTIHRRCRLLGFAAKPTPLNAVASPASTNVRRRIVLLYGVCFRWSSYQHCGLERTAVSGNTALVPKPTAMGK